MNIKLIALCLLSFLSINLIANGTEKAGDKKKKQAKKEKTANSLLWKVEGNGLTSPSYLFGTMHMICEEDFKMFEKVKRTVDEVETLVLEIDMDDPTMMQEMMKNMMTTEKLSETLSEKEYAIVSQFVADNIGAPMDKVDNMTLETLSILGLQAQIGCQNIKSYETELIGLAHADSMEVIGLETVAEQMEYLNNSFDKDEMIEQLQEYNEFAELMKTTTQYYVEERLQECIDMLHSDKSMTKQSLYWMLEIRNKNWVKIMPAQMKEESLLYAVGAAHLAGEYGLITLLEAEGYIVSPVLD